jgi:acyl-coenzyme A synthetase/AMP-(fatty) acid ligase
MHPAVSDAAIVGVADDVAGERPLAFVIASNQDMTSEEYRELLLDLEKQVQNQLDQSHWLRQRVCFVEDLPKSQAGKVLKKKLRDAVTRYNLTVVASGARLKIDY